jgi:hypothetical protein
MTTWRTRQQWADIFAKQAKKRQATQARADREAARPTKANKGKAVPHPLLSAPGHEHYQREAERRVERRRQAEHARRHEVHPQIAHYGQIAIPPASEPPSRKRK